MKNNKIFLVLTLLVALVSACASSPASQQNIPDTDKQPVTQHSQPETNAIPIAPPPEEDPTEPDSANEHPQADTEPESTPAEDPPAKPKPVEPSQPEPAEPPEEQPTQPISIRKITLDPAALTLEVGQTASLTAVHPADTTHQEIDWSSGDSKVAEVSDGQVTAKAPGTTEITVTAQQGDKTATASVTVNQPQKNATDEELLMLGLVNQEREEAGLQPLELNMDLLEVARVKSQDMIDHDYFAHDSPTYGTPFEMMQHFGISFGHAAENLALNSGVAAAHQGLMNSSGHRANILNPNLTEIGIGIIRTSQGQYYITQMFID